MPEFNLLQTYPKANRNIASRKKFKTKKIISLSRQYGKHYFDGARKYGYGGYYYDGRWKKVAKEIIKKYKLKKGDRVLDIGCAKGFLVKDLVDRGIDAYGIDISRYALLNCHEDVVGRLQLGNAKKLPFPDKSFDFTISINTIHNLSPKDCILALKEMKRLSGSKSFVQVDSYRNKNEKKLFLNWVLTAFTHFYPNGWKKIFKKANYKGDYYWTIV